MGVKEFRKQLKQAYGNVDGLGKDKENEAKDKNDSVQSRQSR